MSISNEKLWTSNFLIVSLVNFILTMIFYLLVVTIASYAVNEFHASTSQAGLVSGIFIVGTLIGRLFAGRVIDGFGHKKMLMLGLFLFSILTSLYFVHAGIIGLIIIRFVHGVVFGLAATATGTIVAQIIPQARKGEGIGYYSMFSTLGTAIGPFLGLFIGQHSTDSVIFTTCLFLGIICFISAFFTQPRAIKQTKTTMSDTPKRKGISIAQYLELNALPIAIVTLLVSLGYAAVLSFISFYAEERDLVNEASFFFVVYAIAILLTRPFTGRWIDTKGANFVMYPCFILMGLGLLLLSISHSGFILLLSGALIGIGFGNIQSAAQAIAVKLTPINRMGLATSTYFIFLDAGLGFGPSLLGLFIPFTGYGGLYFGLGIFVVFLIVAYYFLHGRKDRSLLLNNQ